MSTRDQLVPNSSPRRILVAVEENARTTAAAHEQAADLVVMPMPVLVVPEP